MREVGPHLIWIQSVESIYPEVNGHGHDSFQGLELFQKGIFMLVAPHITEMHIGRKEERVEWDEVALLKSCMRKRGEFGEVFGFNPNTPGWKVTRRGSVFRRYMVRYLSFFLCECKVFVYDGWAVWSLSVSPAWSQWCTELNLLLFNRIRNGFIVGFYIVEKFALVSWCTTEKIYKVRETIKNNNNNNIFIPSHFPLLFCTP